MALDFGAHDDVVFNDAPLLAVLCQVQFSPILSLLAEAGAAGFQEALRRDYPEALPREQTTNIQLTADLVGVNQAPPVWRYKDTSGSWTIGLSSEFVSIETRQYTDIDEFLRRFNRVLHVLHKTLRPSPTKRIGLRKINFFPVRDEDGSATAKQAFRDEFLGVLAVQDFPAQVTGYTGFVEFKEEENHLAVRSGLGTTQDDRMGFFLDMDYWTERPFQIGANQEFESVLRHFSNGMTNFFHWSLREEFKQTLNPRPRREEARTQ